MTAYAIARLMPTGQPHDEVLDYIERIQATMDPYEGRFLVHGTAHEVMEGDWPGSVVVIGFPSLDAARAWYDSDAYRALIPLRTRHIPGDIILVRGTGPDYDPHATAAALRASRDGTP